MASTRPPFRGKSVTHVSGTFCYLCVEPHTNRYKPCFARRKTPVDSAYELILGSSADPQFGPVLLVGQGGQNT
jgi:hypothetical protein